MEVSEAKADNAIELVCRAGHKLSASVNVSLDITATDAVTIAQPEGDNIDVYCEFIGECNIGIDPDVEMRAKALLTSFPASLPSEVEIRTCSSCGCTEYAPCEHGCIWVSTKLCSNCADKDTLANVAIKPCEVCQATPHDRSCPRAAVARLATVQL
jgi:hypothetical protein